MEFAERYRRARVKMEVARHSQESKYHVARFVIT